MHQVWHVAVLGVTLFAAAGLVIVLLAPLVFDEPPPGLSRARPFVVGLAGAAGLLLVGEWLLVHGRSV